VTPTADPPLRRRAEHRKQSGQCMNCEQGEDYLSWVNLFWSVPYQEISSGYAQPVRRHRFGSTLPAAVMAGWCTAGIDNSRQSKTCCATVHFEPDELGLPVNRDKGGWRTAQPGRACTLCRPPCAWGLTRSSYSGLPIAWRLPGSALLQAESGWLRHVPRGGASWRYNAVTSRVLAALMADCQRLTIKVSHYLTGLLQPSGKAPQYAVPELPLLTAKSQGQSSAAQRIPPGDHSFFPIIQCHIRLPHRCY